AAAPPQPIHPLPRRAATGPPRRGGPRGRRGWGATYLSPVAQGGTQRREPPCAPRFLLVPFAHEGPVVTLPLALEPDRGGRDALLAQGIHRHDVVAPRRLARCGVGEGRFAGGFGRQARDGLVGEAAVQAVDAMALEPSFRVRRPAEVAAR